MALHLVIDGYNLIRSSPSLSRQESHGLEEGREALLTRLSAYKKIKPRPITVVFDAAESFHLSTTKEQVRGIKVTYSPAGKTADQIIIKMARRLGSQALVVTSDRPLAQAVEAAGATAVSSSDFEDRMEMAFYLESKGMMDEEDEETEGCLSTRKKGPSRRRPKTARHREAKLKKI